MSDTHQSAITRTISDGLHVVCLPHGGVNEVFVTVVPRDGGDFHTMFDKAMTAVRDAGAVVLRQDVFGTPALQRAAHEALAEICGKPDWPITWLEEGASEGIKLTGTHLQAVSGVDVDRIRSGDRVIGSVYENGSGHYCRLGDMRADSTLPRNEQARLTFEHIEEALSQAGMDFSHVVRTWLYLDKILDWYDDFNVVRTEFFKKRRTFEGLVPASTGIGGSNDAGAAVIADVLAVKPKDGQLKTFPVASPLQCPAIDYGSSFSRAAEIAAPDHRRLLISGTASIEPGGETVHVDDVKGQIELTMDVVHAILTSRGMDWEDVTRAIAYVKLGADAEIYKRYCEEKKLPPLPVVIAENDICRDDLLFEIEMDAITA